jgi:hypothetical protein
MNWCEYHRLDDVGKTNSQYMLLTNSLLTGFKELTSDLQVHARTGKKERVVRPSARNRQKF